MAHETHHGPNMADKKSVISFSSSFWLVIILVFLFIGAINFVQVVSNSGEEEKPKNETNVKAAGTGEKEQPKKAEAPAENTAKDNHAGTK